MELCSRKAKIYFIIDDSCKEMMSINCGAAVRSQLMMTFNLITRGILIFPAVGKINNNIFGI